MATNFFVKRNTVSHGPRRNKAVFFHPSRRQQPQEERDPNIATKAVIREGKRRKSNFDSASDIEWNNINKELKQLRGSREKTSRQWIDGEMNLINA